MKKCGRPKKWDHDEICKAFPRIPLFREGPSGTLLLMILEYQNHALELFDMMGEAREQRRRGRSTTMSTSPSIANDSTTLCSTRLGLI